MRDKKKSSITLKSVMQNDKSIQQTQQEKAESTITAYKYTPGYAEQAKQYNQSITALDPNYTNIKPTSKVIIRCFINEPEVTEAGLVMPYRQVLAIPTKSGVPGFHEFEIDWPYKQKAVVISVPENMTSVKPGDIVHLTRNAVEIRMLGQGTNAMPVIANGFVHIDAGTDVTPKEINSPHYGYVLVPVSEIQAVYGQ